MINHSHYSLSKKEYNTFFQNTLSSLSNSGNYQYSLVMLEDDKLVQHIRNTEPCYGGMRKYRVTHGKLCTLPKTQKPNDLYHPFPNGKVMMCFVRLSPIRFELMRLLTEPRSPWVNGFGSPDNVIFHDKEKIICLTDTRIDPSVFVNMLRYSFNFNTEEKIENNPEFYYSYLLSPVLTGYTRGMYAHKVDFRNFMSGKTLDITGGTWYDGYDYNRLWNEQLFANLKPGVNMNEVREESYSALLANPRDYRITIGLTKLQEMEEKLRSAK